MKNGKTYTHACSFELIQSSGLDDKFFNKKIFIYKKQMKRKKKMIENEASNQIKFLIVNNDF